MKRLVLLLALVFALGASRVPALAGPTGPPDDPPAQTGTDVAAWTFMVYLAADNDLEGDGVNDLLEMAEVGSDEDVNIVVLVDRSAEYSDAPAANLVTTVDPDGGYGSSRAAYQEMVASIMRSLA